MANRFYLEREDGFTLVSFGLLNKKGDLLDRFSCCIPDQSLNSQKENLVQYSDKIGLPKKKIPAWKCSIKHDEKLFNIPVVDFVHVSQWDDSYAEICFWNYSRGFVSDLVQSGAGEEVTPFGVGMVRCNIDLQRAFLAELYEDLNETAE